MTDPAKDLCHEEGMHPDFGQSTKLSTAVGTGKVEFQRIGPVCGHSAGTPFHCASRGEPPHNRLAMRTCWGISA